MLRGRDRAEYERLMSEMVRLRESWVTQEMERIRLAAREAGLLAQLANVNKVTYKGSITNCISILNLQLSESCNLRTVPLRGNCL